ncbi:MAG: ABC transporter substrate-binding protein [Alphaproteobacteria bacterium]|nr:ABC transporter substrate-binding protein [Alphaproteobacteria bacterium]
MKPRCEFRIGLLRLTDAAPLIVAKELGFFAAEGVEAALSVEPSWANIADKLCYGLLDAAMMLPPLALALRLGLSGSTGPERIVVPLALSLNGNTVTLSEDWSAAMLRASRAGEPLSALDTARRFAAVIRHRRRKPHLAVVHTFSTHNLLLRYWLAAGGIDPDQDVSFTVVPPAETVAAMAAGRIDGFCAGAPWGELAARDGLGRAVATSHGIWNNFTEKVLAIRESLVERDRGQVSAVLRALLKAASYCDAPANAPAIAALLSRDQYLGLPAEIILTSLPGAAARRIKASFPDADESVFFAHAATFPWRSQAQWFLREMARWGYLDGVRDAAGAGMMFRSDLYAAAARLLDLPVPATALKSEGDHTAPWLLPGSPVPFEMRPDCLMDGASFDPAREAREPPM